MTDNMKNKGFTLVELLVVIVIISMLALASTKMIGAAKNAGHAARCQGNLKALWQGAMNKATDNDAGFLPYAGSHEYFHSFDQTYHCHNGWICWTPDGGVDNTYYWGSSKKPDEIIGSVPQHGGGRKQSFANQLRHRGVGGSKVQGNDSAALDSIRNSYFFDYVNQDLSIYCCPTFRAEMKDARRSYVMNAWFGSRRCIRHEPVRLHNLGGKQASRILLFTEMTPDLAKSGGADNGGEDARNGNQRGNLPQDSVLDCLDDDVKETYGAIHKKAGLQVAHAIFLDGHIESLSRTNPKNKGDANYQKDTTRKICSGNW